ncbi:FecCD family ABC transporter permease [Priestia filamentosa]|uniref:Ferrichrome ABC transporter permease n=1 Tax=Priestia filamentosa TaxID=1402861 RepID=A0A1X7G7J6_9BACI|nr:iron ABC transporter permease [Priestia filamentosa]AKO94859.1 ferrichrome ABC transporter permease [Priestia filamentosa]MDT3765201.1 iron ABC transporter permease [Priestia filamentosa]OXS65669.1 ferrichrome ABC transporter permease [Priestia filamentosa]WCM15780.1 iron ABC transporter permease [Priestia filamentosa]WRU95490.1 iron ABC transporter permease [Priestia filamentosa]
MGNSLSNEFIRKRTSTVIFLSFLLALIILCICVFIGITFGAKNLDFQTVWQATFHYNNQITAQQIIHELRLPRVIGAAVIGAAFAVAGALIQGVTRNPLGDTGVLGINGGSMLIVALCFAFLPNLSYPTLMVFSFIGAILSTLLIFAISVASRGGFTPMKLTVAGAVIAALLHSLTTGVAIYYDLSQDLAFWYAGGVSGVKWSHLFILVPIILVVIGISTCLGKSLSLIAMGDDMAANLGVKTLRVKAIGIVLAVILAGVSVSVAGSIGFIGLVIPHIARKIVGTNYYAIIPMSALLGAILLVIADLGARTVDPPRELAIGIMVAFVGVPFFLYIARKIGREL